MWGRYLDDRDKHSLHSTLRENIIEHLFIGALLQRLWQRNVVDAEVLKSEFDAGGYDLVLTFREITRHVQLKVTRSGGARSDVNVSLRLADKPSGCVVWIIVDDGLGFVEFRWFGAVPGEPLPDIQTMKITKHNKGNAQGIKNERPGHRQIRHSSFRRVEGIDGLLECLLGDTGLST